MSEDKPEVLDTESLVSLTIITLFIAGYGKLTTFGWRTIALIATGVLPIHFVLFTVCGIVFAKSKNKVRADYKYFFALCITLILYTFTFRDFGDVEKPMTSEVIRFIDNYILPAISIISFCANIVLMIITFKRLGRKK